MLFNVMACNIFSMENQAIISTNYVIATQLKPAIACYCLAMHTYCTLYWSMKGPLWEQSHGTSAAITSQARRPASRPASFQGMQIIQGIQGIASWLWNMAVLLHCSGLYKSLIQTNTQHSVFNFDPFGLFSMDFDFRKCCLWKAIYF